MLVDLHAHTTCSDGVLGPTDLVARMAQAGVGVMAVTDHDSVQGVASALAEGNRRGIEVVAGVEVSTRLEPYSQVHVLGYDVDWTSPQLLRTLDGIREARTRRAVRIIDAINGTLAGQGRAPLLDFEAIRSEGHDSIGRPHIARALVSLGHARDIDDAFALYLDPFDRPKKRVHPSEAIAAIREAGGVPVLAHPVLTHDDRGRVVRLVDDCLAWGVEGIEVYHGRYDAAAGEFCLRIARERRLLVTGGSDFHDPAISTPGHWGAGVIPTDIFEPLRERFRTPSSVRHGGM